MEVYTHILRQLLHLATTLGGSGEGWSVWMWDGQEGPLRIPRDVEECEANFQVVYDK